MEIILAYVICFTLMICCLATVRKVNSFLDVNKQVNDHIYGSINKIRDEIRAKTERIEMFEKALESIVQNLALDPLFYNKLFAVSNGTRQFTYQDLTHLMTEYNEFLANGGAYNKKPTKKKTTKKKTKKKSA